jgi:cytochrome c556
VSAFTIAGAAIGGPAAAPVLTAEQVIAARQASLDLSVMDMAEMKLAQKDGIDVKKQYYPAKTLARWAKALPTMFPQGTGQGATASETHALPGVWTDRAGFEKAAANYADAADKLAARARNGDTSGFQAQLATVAKTCDACHEDYQAK